MIDHFGYIVRLALANIDDEAIKQEIENHARSAITGKPCAGKALERTG
jgi:hypothetical protein